MRFSLPMGILLILLVGLCAPAFGNPLSPVLCDNPGSTHTNSTDNFVNANSCTDFSFVSPNNQASPMSNWLYGYYGGLLGGPAGTLAPSGFHAMQTMNMCSIDLNGHMDCGQVIDPNTGHFGWWAVDFAKYWTSLDAFGGHANSVNTDLHDAPFCINGQNCGSGPDSNPSVDQWAVKRYVVPIAFNGLVNITIKVQKDPRTLNTSPRADGDSYTAYFVNNQNAGAVTTLNALAVSAGPNDPTVYMKFSSVMVHGGDFLDFAMSPNASDYSDGAFELITLQSIPEPATLLLVGAGLALTGLKSRRKYSKPS